MDYCGVICEYNPFHSGHLHQLNEIKKRLCDCGIICVMSGNFVQRAEPAIVNKLVRTKIALEAGADAVIQIPTAHTVCGGEAFARSAIGILQSISGLRYLAFGCETQSFELLKTLASIQADESTLFSCEIRRFLQSGMPYPAALSAATTSIAGRLGCSEDECKKILNRPNNILAIEYLKVIYQNKLNIEPIFIHRVDNYNSHEIGGKFASATALRRVLLSGNTLEATRFLPYDAEALLSDIVDYELFDQLVLFSLRRAGREQIARLADCCEGMEHRLFANILACSDLNSALEKTKTKRYTYARLKRLCAQSLLSLTKETTAFLKNPSHIVEKGDYCNAALSDLVSLNKNDTKNVENNDYIGAEKDAIENVENSDYTNVEKNDYLKSASSTISKSCYSLDNMTYGKLLGVKKSLKKRLGDFSGDILTSHKDIAKRIGSAPCNLSIAVLAKLIEIDCLADDIYSQLTHSPAGAFFASKLIEI